MFDFIDGSLSNSVQNRQAKGLCLMVQTALGYEHLFTPEDTKLMKLFLDLDPFYHSLIAKMFFRKRSWYNHEFLTKYESDEGKVRDAIDILIELGFLQNTDDVLIDPNKAKSLLDDMTSEHVRTVLRFIRIELGCFPLVTTKHFIRHTAFLELFPFITDSKDDLSECIKFTLKKYSEWFEISKSEPKISKLKDIEEILQKLDAYISFKANPDKSLLK